jgi:hypothetical protein
VEGVLTADDIRSLVEGYVPLVADMR